MNDQQVKSQQQAPEQVKEQVKEKVAPLAAGDFEPFAAYGRFEFFKSVIRKIMTSSGEQMVGVENMDPASGRSARFLKDPEWQKERKELKARLELWKMLVSGAASLEDLQANAVKQHDDVSKLKKDNLTNAVASIRDLEKSYRTIASFFTNAEKAKGAKVENIHFMNVQLNQITDANSLQFLNAIREELEAHYDKLDLNDAYSLLVVPGFLGSNQKLNMVAEVAEANKVMLVTDIDDVENIEEAIDFLEKYKLTSPDLFKAYCCLTCNYIAARPGYPEIDEPAMFIPPSAALAGKLYNNPIEQVSAGNKYGRIREAEGVRFPLKKAEIGKLVDQSVIPAVHDFEGPMFFNDRTTCTADNPGWRIYSVVRTFDFISRTLKDLLGRFVFQNITPDMEHSIRTLIGEFLDRNKGHNRLIENYGDIQLIKDPNDVTKLSVKVPITPWFPAEEFELVLDGRDGKGGSKDWDESISQKK